jgi:hypothetical protein
MIDPGKEYVPFLMLLRRDRPAAGECFIQQFKAGHVQNGKLAPVRQTAAAALACSLIGKEVHNAFLDAIILRFHDSVFTVVGKAQQASLMDRRQDHRVDSGNHIRRRRMPYYVKRAPHLSIMSEPERVNRATLLLS